MPGVPRATEAVDAAPFGGGAFIADKSAWARSDADDVRESWGRALRDGQIWTCPITTLELLYSEQTSRKFEDLEEELSILREAALSRSALDAARSAFRELASHSDGYHRVPLADLLIAACAHEAGVGVLHYDHHYDRLATVLTFESRWLAAPGALD
jgi:predicted nucleic acid-binding protein